MFSCTQWVSTKFRVNSRTFGFTQTWENNITKVLLKLLHVPNKRETWLPCFEIHSKIHSNVTFEWYEDDMVFRVFVVIIFRTNGKKDNWMRKTSVTVMVIFFEGDIMKVTWSQLCSKYLLSNYEAHWQLHLER